MLNRGSSSNLHSELGHLLGCNLGVSLGEKFLGGLLVVKVASVGLRVLVLGTEILPTPALDAQKPCLLSTFGTGLGLELQIRASGYDLLGTRFGERGLRAFSWACGCREGARSIDFVLFRFLHIARPLLLEVLGVLSNLLGHHRLEVDQLAGVRAARFIFVRRAEEVDARESGASFSF